VGECQPYVRERGNQVEGFLKDSEKLSNYAVFFGSFQGLSAVISQAFNG